MRVLWFSVNPACYTEKKNGYNGGGWISALEKIIQKTLIPQHFDLTLFISS